MSNETDASSVGSLETEALRRKERLKAMQRGELKAATASERRADDENLMKEFPKPIFRNYQPKDEELKPGVLPKPNLIEIENAIKEQLASGKPEPLIEKEIDLTTLAPQKIDWDLKRDVEKKLRLLEKRTQRAIVELIKERLKSQKNADLAELVSVGQEKNKNKSEDEESDEEEEEEVENEPTTSNQNDDTDVPFELNTKTEISDDEDY